MCPLCHGKGVICIRYRESEDVDYGMCSCVRGQFVRRHPDALAAVLQISQTQLGRVEELLDLEDFPEAMRASVPSTARADVAEAGRRTGKARL
jgi:hypothetical protein